VISGRMKLSHSLEDIYALMTCGDVNFSRLVGPFRLLSIIKTLSVPKLDYGHLYHYLRLRARRGIIAIPDPRRDSQWSHVIYSTLL
jgi:hypothetical protein